MSGRYGDEIGRAARERLSDAPASDGSGAEHPEDALEAALTASQALLDVATRSVADALEVLSVPQYRTMMELSAKPLTLGELATRLRSESYSLNDVLTGLVDSAWVRVVPGRGRRREPSYELTPHGHQLIDLIALRRRTELASILDSLPRRDRRAVARGFSLFADAADEDRSGHPSTDPEI